MTISPQLARAAWVPLLLLLLPLAAGAQEAPEAGAEQADADSAAAPDALQPGGPWTLPLVLHGGFKGEFGLPDCRAEGGPAVTASNFARLVSAAGTATEEATAAGSLAPLFFHTGDLYYPGALSSHLVDGGAEGAGALLDLLSWIPYDAAALGGLDLSAPLATLPALLDTVSDRGFPLLASNVTCADDASVPGLCRATGTVEGGQPYRIVQRGPLRIAVISALDPTHTREISARKRKGLTFAEVADAVPPLIEKIRGEDEADLVVLLAHTFGKAQEGALLRTLPGIPGLDLVVLKQLRKGTWGKLDPPDGGSTGAGWTVVPKTGTVVLPAGRGVDEQVRAELRIEQDGDGFHVLPLAARIEDATLHEPDPRVGARVQEVATNFCAERGRPVSEDFPLAAPMEEADFARWVLDVMRDEAKTELALINAGAVRNKDLLPLRDHITRADLQSLLPFGGDLVKAKLQGDDLLFLAGLLGTTALMSGLERVDGRVRVNGRSVDPSRKYSVVMNRFTADGGDEILTVGSLSKRVDLAGEDEEPIELVGLLGRALEERRFAHRKDGALHPGTRFVDLHLKPRFRFSGSLNASYSKIAVANPELEDGSPAYSSGELTGISVDSLYFDTRLGMRVDSRDHEVRLSALLYYALSRYSEEYGGQLETGDSIRGSAVYDFTGLRALAGGKGYVPIPYLELELQSEFDKPDSRDWHRLQGTGIAGVKMRPLSPLSLKVGANVRRELLDPEARTLGGLFVGYSLDRFDLFSILKQPVQLESETDWFFNDIGRDNVHEIRHYTRLYFGLMNRLFFSTTFSAYLYRDEPVGEWGAYADLTIGINVLLAGAAQVR